MAAISNSLKYTKFSPQTHNPKPNTPKSLIISVSCQNNDPSERKNSTKENKGISLPQILGGVKNLGTRLKDNMGPKKKGDWKDLTLMSLSFAVYVYISQQIVCAYCAWMSLPKQSW